VGSISIFAHSKRSCWRLVLAGEQPPRSLALEVDHAALLLEALEYLVRVHEHPVRKDDDVFTVVVDRIRPFWIDDDDRGVVPLLLLQTRWLGYQ
jgi:hypothetical protein